MTNTEIRAKIAEFQARAEKARDEVFQAVKDSNMIKADAEASQDALMNLKIAENLAQEAERAAKKAAKTLNKIKKAKRFDTINKLHDSLSGDFRAAEKAIGHIKSVTDELEDTAPFRPDLDGNGNRT